MDTHHKLSAYKNNYKRRYKRPKQMIKIDNKKNDDNDFYVYVSVCVFCVVVIVV
jgi:hypothetical protein